MNCSVRWSQRPALLEPFPSASTRRTATAARSAAAALGTRAGRGTARTGWGMVEHGAVLGVLTGQYPLQRFDQVDPLDLLRLDPAVGELAGVAQLAGGVEDEEVRRRVGKP